MQLPVVKTDIQIRFSDLDVLGHVSNTVYGNYFELARVRWFNEIPGEKPTVVVVNINMSFRAEVRMDYAVYVETRCAKIGNKSIHLQQDLYANDSLAATATVILVGFSRETRKSAPLPMAWRAMAEPQQQG